MCASSYIVRREKKRCDKIPPRPPQLINTIDTNL